jgi:hypothetical protein
MPCHASRCTRRLADWHTRSRAHRIRRNRRHLHGAHVRARAATQRLRPRVRLRMRLRKRLRIPRGHLALRRRRGDLGDRGRSSLRHSKRQPLLLTLPGPYQSFDSASSWRRCTCFSSRAVRGAFANASRSFGHWPNEETLTAFLASGRDLPFASQLLAATRSQLASTRVRATSRSRGCEHGRSVPRPAPAPPSPPPPRRRRVGSSG